MFGTRSDPTYWRGKNCPLDTKRWEDLNNTGGVDYLCLRWKLRHAELRGYVGTGGSADGANTIPPENSFSEAAGTSSWAGEPLVTTDTEVVGFLRVQHGTGDWIGSANIFIARCFDPECVYGESNCGVARLTSQPRKLWLVDVATDRDARYL